MEKAIEAIGKVILFVVLFVLFCAVIAQFFTGSVNSGKNGEKKS